MSALSGSPWPPPRQAHAPSQRELPPRVPWQREQPCFPVRRLCHATQDMERNVIGMRRADLMRYACSLGVETRRQGPDGKKNLWRPVEEVRAECRERQAATRQRPSTASPSSSADPAARGTDRAPVGGKGEDRARLCQPPDGSSRGVEANRAPLPVGAAASLAGRDGMARTGRSGCGGANRLCLDGSGARPRRLCVLPLGCRGRCSVSNSL